MHLKSPRHKPYRLLKQLPILERLWNSISIDFIEHLPASVGFTSILVVVDRLSKQGIFIPTVDKITAPGLAKLFLIHVFSKHGVPLHVTCDRGSKFISHFFRSLRQALDMKIHFTSGYHPEGDSQTEHLNQTLEQFCKGNLTIKHNAQILARGIQSILDKYNTAEGCIPCKGDPKRKL